MSGPRYQAIDDLIHEIEETAAVVSGIEQGDADPYTLIGLLIEGAAKIAAEGIPQEVGGNVAKAMMIMLHDRLQKQGVGRRGGRSAAHVDRRQVIPSRPVRDRKPLRH